MGYHYDAYGNIAEEDKTMDGGSYSIGYSYDKNGRINKINYPSGTYVLYNYSESLSLPSEVNIKKTDGSILNISITRGADGKIREIIFPSGITETLGYDRQYRMDSFTIEKHNSEKLVDSVYARDLDGNVTFITDTLDAEHNLTFSYDLFGRITDSSGPYGNLDLSYDGVGNRIQSVLNGVERNYSYSDNKLSSVSGDMTKNYSYNSEGKLISDGNVSLSYDKNNRIQSVNIGGNKNVSYRYDFEGRRDKKSKEGNWQNYFYDLEGRLISVMDRNGNCLADFIYAGDERIAVVIPQSETPVGSYRRAKGKAKHRKEHLLGTYKMKFKMAKQTSNFGDNLNQSINIINEGTLIKGDISANGDIRIDGELRGNIDARGRLVIGPKGKVEGEIDCNNIEVSGYLKGKITVSELLTMKYSARIFGDVIAGKLSVEPGSLFTGTCTMGDSKEKDEKQIPKEQKKV